jgi:UPF0755 protein
MDDDHLDWPDWVNQADDAVPAPRSRPEAPGAVSPPRPANPAEAPTAPHEAVNPTAPGSRRSGSPPPRTARPNASRRGAPAVPPAQPNASRRGAPAVPPAHRSTSSPPPTARTATPDGAATDDPAGRATPLGPDHARAARRDHHKAERSRRRRRRIGVLVVLALLLLPFLAAVGWFWWQIDPLTGPGAAVEIKVKEDWGVSEIADELSREGVIGSSLAFKVYAKVTGGGPFQAGTYDLQENMGARAAIAALEDGPQPARRGIELALPPGLTIDEIAAIVGETSPKLSAERFLEVANSGTVRSIYQPADVTSLEGLLYPDTYFVGRDADEEDIVRLLVQTFDQKATAAGIETAPNANLTPYEAVIVASLIQNETGIPEELPLVSAVIRNRLEDGDLLQIDFTLCYAKGGCPPPPSNADKDIDSPYNTYLYAGLPPTPISSVTEEMIRAAVSPADVSYKFYVLTDDEGHHAFADTFAEHEANIADAEERGVL